MSDSISLLGNLDSIPDTSARVSQDDIGGLMINASKTIHYKKIFLVWLAFLIMNSEIFIDKFIAMFDGAICDGYISMKGTFVMSIVLVLILIAIDMIF